MQTCPASGTPRAQRTDDWAPLAVNQGGTTGVTLAPFAGREFFYGREAAQVSLAHALVFARLAGGAWEALLAVQRGWQGVSAVTDVALTQLLYHEDSYLKTFDATVVAVEDNAVALDRTAFYPGGGGQMADRGGIVWSGQRLPLARIEKRGDVVWHTLETEGPLPAPGEGVQGEIDWDFRYRMMRTHTALHMLCGIIFRDFGAQVTGGQMYPEKARMDFSTDTFTQEWVRDIERRVNEAVGEDHPITVYSLPRDEAFAIPDLIRTKINLLPPEISSIRIVEIVGLDLQADGGTHVRSTREVGGIRVLKTENKGKQNKRMEIALVDTE